MKSTFVALTSISSIVSLASVAFIGTAHAEGPSCDNARLMKTLSQQLGGKSLGVKTTDEAVVVHDLKTNDQLLRVTCDEVSVPFAEKTVRPRHSPASTPATTKTIGPVTLSVTARGAVSLDIAPGALHREGLQLLLLDDQSVSLTRGEDVLYAFATRPDGSTVETEGRGVGCGCVKTTLNGKTTTRPL